MVSKGTGRTFSSTSASSFSDNPSSWFMYLPVSRWTFAAATLSFVLKDNERKRSYNLHHTLIRQSFFYFQKHWYTSGYRTLINSTWHNPVPSVRCRNSFMPTGASSSRNTRTNTAYNASFTLMYVSHFHFDTHSRATVNPSIIGPGVTSKDWKLNGIIGVRLRNVAWVVFVGCIQLPSMVKLFLFASIWACWHSVGYTLCCICCEIMKEMLLFLHDKGNVYNKNYESGYGKISIFLKSKV